jgi:hypothetical protein
MDYTSFSSTRSHDSVFRHVAFILMGFALFSLALLPPGVSANQQGPGGA